MQLRLLSLNVWGLPWPISRVPDERIRRIARQLPALELDAVGFQEAWSADARAVLVQGGHQAGLPYAWHRDEALGNGGILVLSRWPIRETRYTTFDLGGLPQRVQHFDYYGGKGFAQCVLDTPAGEFELFATHLHAGYGKRGDADEYFGHRAAQAIELALGVATSSRPLAVLGDLNAELHSDEMRILLGATGLTDTAMAAGNPESTLVSDAPRAAEASAPAKRIDYVLARSGTRLGIHPLTSRRTFDVPFLLEGREEAHSDHYGVLAELDLSGPGHELPAATPDSLERARRALRHGERLAHTRQAEQRVAALGAGLLALGSGATARYTRRQWLRRAGLSVAALATLPAALWAALAEGFTPTELAGFHRVATKLEQLARLTEGRR